jgi:hypothetical protein
MADVPSPPPIPDGDDTSQLQAWIDSLDPLEDTGAWLNGQTYNTTMALVCQEGQWFSGEDIVINMVNETPSAPLRSAAASGQGVNWFTGS